MATHRAIRPWAAVAFGVVLGLASPVEAAEPVPLDPTLQEQLASGEFAPALEAAHRAPSAALRDTLLTQVALAQARAGSSQAAIQTASQISGDQARAQALSGVAAQPLGGFGGAAMADFESLIELIVTTIQPTTWDEVGGPGSIAEFPTGVHVDPQGMLQRLPKAETDEGLSALRASAATRRRHESARRQSPLRMVSLPRLEKHVQLRLAAGLPPTEAMQVLAGLQRIEYVFAYPETGDLVLAGPAGDWRLDAENHCRSVDTGRPVLRLDDLVVIFRHVHSAADPKFGCMINPRQEALAKVQAFLDKSSKVAIRPDDRRAWLERLRSQLGKQDIVVYGLDPRTRAARVMVEADYRMKLVGMGLEEGVPGVKSYLDLIEVPPGGSPPPMGVLRWWFTLNYDALVASKDRRAFALRGQGVKVMSENERLTAEGKRIHTGQSEQLNQAFARSFTEHFEAMAAKYPIYAELRNLFDLALVAALVREEGLAEKVGWHLTCFGDAQAFPVELANAPKQVETVVNHRLIHDRRAGRVHVIAGVSGGVEVQPAALVAPQAIHLESDNRLAGRHAYVAPKPEMRPDAWWWD
ncbi:MAG: DUF1598 domain-containing protein [Thermoguttaceae bacterium]|jgi:hypothetical protein|nr:DUF1598 domain-containing protein [Thermoguttaceae bacterium]